MELGFIGLGIMGFPMVSNLCAKGEHPRVFDLREEAVASACMLGAIAAAREDIAKQSDIIFTILPNGSIVQDMLFGENGLAGLMKPETVFVDCSSETPQESRFCFRTLSERHIHFLDAPVSGGEPGAINGTLAFMVGGEELVFERVYPLMMKMGASAVYMGASGSGSITKLANQIIVNAGITAVAEAMVLAATGGVDTGKVYEAIKGGLAGSAVLDAKAPMMTEHNFTPGGTITVNYKDITNVITTAESLGLELPLAKNVYNVMTELLEDGHGKDDHSGIVQYYEKRFGVCVKSQKPMQ